MEATNNTRASRLLSIYIPKPYFHEANYDVKDRINNVTRRFWSIYIQYILAPYTRHITSAHPIQVVLCRSNQQFIGRNEVTLRLTWLTKLSKVLRSLPSIHWYSKYNPCSLFLSVTVGEGPRRHWIRHWMTRLGWACVSVRKEAVTFLRRADLDQVFADACTKTKQM